MCQPGFQLPAPAFCGLRASFGYPKPALPAYVVSCKYPGINASQEQLHPKTDGSWYINTPAASLRWDNSEVCVLHWLPEFSMELSSRYWLVAGLGWPKSWLGFPIISNGRTQTNFLANSINLLSVACPILPRFPAPYLVFLLPPKMSWGLLWGNRKWDWAPKGSYILSWLDVWILMKAGS